jgi:hypothetical protein
MQMVPLVHPFLERDFAIGHIAWGVTSQLVNFVSHLSSVLFRTILLISRVTQFTAVLHALSLVPWHHCPSFLLCFNKWSRPGIAYFPCKVVVFLVRILDAETIEAEKSRAALSASLGEWSWIFGDVSSERGFETALSLSVFQLDLKRPSSWQSPECWTLLLVIRA